MSENETVILDFEKTIVEIEEKINHLQSITKDNDLDVGKEIKRLQKHLKTHMENVYKHLTPWQKAQIARHPARPHCLNYINGLIEDFVLLCGDRCFGDDKAIVGGIGNFEGIPVVVIGQEKGNDLDSRIKYNFGMARPEGYRKAQRLMDMAEKFKLPVLTFVDTAGAYPGVDAEERGQAEAIASSIEKCLRVKTPIIATVIGEGGSGGAIAIAVADRVLMLEHSIYSVISPEGCASILWRSAEKTKEATEALHLTAQDLRKLGIIDEIVPEPLGGAHRDSQQAIEFLRVAIKRNLQELVGTNYTKLKKARTNKFMNIGSQFVQATTIK
ncbi:MAG: acetyl-CoA carboxylase carboxyltransferase subunit alpha [Alphaproteobacteria bacterium]|nr:acetyl-CoA carboxylase carboxyltransferase subunit alpha [Alphaproteobacteria bacterium]MBR3501606.1 acetyl-CoA carboxylase carboxyltransferase subunit alpha [Alphaproteobacteria bacterium]